jgi:ubiquinone/menaquinone biosynthesis C-methylase UbiE
LSTRALLALADHCIGLDAAEPMLHAAAALVPGAAFLAAHAEAIPLVGGSVGLITAAGSLNYTDVPRFFEEASRVLTPEGLVLAYDFSPGQFSETWFRNFIARYPWPPNDALELSPERLAAMSPGFRLRGGQTFEITLSLTRDFYQEYMMTETNVAFARRNGVPEAEIRSWCSATLAAEWGEHPRDVLFRGYYACLAAIR